MIIIDASVLANALTDDGALGRRGRLELGRDPHWAAPHHVIVEVFSAIRGRWLGRKLTDFRAVNALAAVTEASIDLLDTTPLLARMWELRDNVTGNDAAYVAAAEAEDCPLVTADRRLAEIAGLRCEIRVAT